MKALKEIIALLLLISLLSMTLGIPSGNALPMEIRGSWNFDEGAGDKAHDSTCYGNDGTLVGAPEWVWGKFGHALSFDGGKIDDWVQVPDSGSLDLTDALILEAWIKPDKYIPSNYAYNLGIICKWHGVNPFEFRTGYCLSIGCSKETGTLSYLYLILGFGSGKWGTYHSNITNSWNEDVWYHVKATYDRSLPSGQVKIYINNVPQGQYDETRPIATNTLPLFIPVDPNEGHPLNKLFPGIIDEVKVGGCVGGVGGFWVPVDKLGLLAPYIGLASTIIVATAATAIYVKHGKKK